MGGYDYMASPQDDWMNNVAASGSIDGTKVAGIGQKLQELSGEDHAAIREFFDVLIDYENEYRGIGAEALRGKVGQVESHARLNRDESAKDAAKIKSHGANLDGAKGIIAKNDTCDMGTPISVPANACAKAFEDVMRPPGSWPYEPNDSLVDPDAPPPSALAAAPAGVNGAGGGGSGPGPTSGGHAGTTGGDDAGAGDFAATRTSSGQPSEQAGKGDGAGNPQGGGSPGDPSGAGGAPSGGPPGGGPSGPPPGGLDPQASGDPAGFDLGDTSATGTTNPSGFGGGALAGGVGGLGAGDRERPLSNKPSGGGAARPAVNVNVGRPPGAPGTMGGPLSAGGVAPGAVRKKEDDKEVKAQSYLSNDDNTYELLGGAMPSANAPVLGDLTKTETQERDEKTKEQGQEKPKLQPGPAPAPPPTDPPRRDQL